MGPGRVGPGQDQTQPGPILLGLGRFRGKPDLNPTLQTRILQVVPVHKWLEKKYKVNFFLNLQNLISTG